MPLRRHVRGRAVGAKSTKGWARLKPSRKSDRRALKKRCGASAFLDPKKLKYPVVAVGGGCTPDCRGIRSAKARAAQGRHRKLVAKAERLAKRVGCKFARRKP
jgi:hypothetical protein